MRKFIVLSIIGLLVLFGTIVHAQDKLDFKVSGFMFAQTFLARNVPNAYDMPPWSPIPAWLPPIYGPSPLLNPSTGDGRALDKTRSWIGERAILHLDMSMGKNLSGRVTFEMDSAEWGERGEGRNNVGRWNADQAGVEVKSLYLDVGLPYFGIPVPITARLGVQPFAIRPTMTGYIDGPGITGGIRIDPVTIQPLWFKAVENLDFSADDMDVYGLHAFGKFGGTTVGGYGLYWDAKTYPIPAAVSSTNPHSAKLGWLGLYTDGRFGPLDVNFDLVSDLGKVEANRNLPHQDVKYFGWAGRLKIDYPWEKFNFGAVGMYASGSDQKKTDGGAPGGTGGLPGNTTPFGTPTTRVSGYMAQPGSEQFPFGDTLMISGQPVVGGFIGYHVLNYAQVSRGSIGGTWIAKLYGSYKVAPWYKVTLAGIYLGDTTKHGNTMGSARTAAGLPRDDKTIGWELDFIHEFNIYKNLKYDVGFSYLFAGKALDYFDARVSPGRNISGKDPWMLASRLTYSF